MAVMTYFSLDVYSLKGLGQDGLSTRIRVIMANSPFNTHKQEEISHCKPEIGKSKPEMPVYTSFQFWPVEAVFVWTPL